ncbi:unnamed protein product [Prunus brigantina]
MHNSSEGRLIGPILIIPARCMVHIRLIFGGLIFARLIALSPFVAAMRVGVPILVTGITIVS